MRVYLHRAAGHACATCMRERIETALKKGMSWEDTMDSMRGLLSTYISKHTMCMLKDDMLALNAYKYGAPYATYTFNRLGRYVKFVPNKFVYVNNMRHDVLTAPELLELLCPKSTVLFKRACLSWIVAVHMIAPDMRIEKFYKAYMRVLRWFSTGKGTRPTFWDVDTTYRILESM